MRPGLSLSFGLRYDWQNYFHDNNNFAPRFSVAYAPGNKKTNVLRAGVGVFNDRSGPVVIADVLHSQPGGLIKLRHHRSRLSRSVRDRRRRGVAAAEHRAARARRADSADAAVQRRRRSSAAEDDDALGDLHRRARLPPVPLARRQRAAAAALPARGPIRRTAPSARSSRPAGRRRDSLQVTLRGRVTRWFNGQMQYTLSRVVQRHQRHRRRFRPTTTTCRASGRAPTSIAGIASCCSAPSPASSSSTSAWR